MPGNASRSRRPVPISVPPVPRPATSASTLVEVGRDLRAGALVVRVDVRLVRVLEEHHVPVVARDDLLGEPHRAVRAQLARRLDHRRAVELEQLSPLGRRVRRHDARQLQAAQLRDERERDAGVAARRLEQLLAGCELRRIDHRQRDAILDRAGRVLPLELRVDPAALRLQVRQLDEGGVADELEEATRRHRPWRAGESPSCRSAPVSRGRCEAARPRRRRRRSRTRAGRPRRRCASPSAGIRSERSSITSRSVAPSASTSRAPPASERRTGGIRTTLIACRTPRSRCTR